MNTVIAILVGIFKGIALLVKEFPWLKFAAVVFVTFFIGCLYGRRMRAEAPPVRVIQPREPLFPNLPHPFREDEQRPVEVTKTISTPVLPEAANHFVDANKKPLAPAALQPQTNLRPAAACVGGSCAMPQRRLFGRWR